ncbi:hypothetical protein RW1_035_00140 [Rhodococcus wratislaviensis NBRC 100605]|uniref:Uncharacterized protein n=1 Tax=Rhodococcus wratislaviensis NBRC 100605 TaxID=1219028 RepID=X0Q7S3_RHOWR|nr:hypothetical protein RW1_035_00140 [Rhodococcus wratislaviensis NBRC 100605]
MQAFIAARKSATKVGILPLEVDLLARVERSESIDFDPKRTPAVVPFRARQ